MGVAVDEDVFTVICAAAEEQQVHTRCAGDARLCGDSSADSGSSCEGILCLEYRLAAVTTREWGRSGNAVLAHV